MALRAASKEKAKCALFVEALMDHIMEGAMIPKVQIERATGPILSMFLTDVLTETLRDDPALSGSIAMICPEFLLKEADNVSVQSVFKPGNKDGAGIPSAAALQAVVSNPTHSVFVGARRVLIS